METAQQMATTWLLAMVVASMSQVIPSIEALPSDPTRPLLQAKPATVSWWESSSALSCAQCVVVL